MTAALALGPTFAPLGAQGSAPEDTDRFLSVPKWYVTYTIIVEGRFEQRSENFGAQTWVSVRRVHRGSFVADVQTPDPGVIGPMARAMRAQGGIPEILWEQRGVRLGGQPSTVFVEVEDDFLQKHPPATEGYDLTGDPGNKLQISSYGQGPAAAPETGALRLDLRRRTFRLDFPYKAVPPNEGPALDPSNPAVLKGRTKTSSGPKPVQRTERRHEWDTPKQKVQETRKSDRLALHEVSWQPDLPVITGIPLPASGLDLSGGVTFRMRVDGYALDPDDQAAVSVAWTCTPFPPPEVELQVEPMYYDFWRPMAGNADGAPLPEGTAAERNDLAVKLSLIDPRTGTLARLPVRKFIARLSNVSRQTGVCINYPVAPRGPADFDLKIRPSTFWSVEADGQTATRDSPNPLAVLNIACYDYGAWGSLEVRAELMDGREVAGYLRGNRQQREIKIPQRTGSSLIAESWLRRHGKMGAPDNADDEDEPRGSDSKGDGLTLYEEYRGFVMGEVWFPGSPKQRELFLQASGSTAQLQEGISRFRTATKVVVVDSLGSFETDIDGVVNFNGRGGPHVVDQRAVAVRLVPGYDVHTVPTSRSFTIEVGTGLLAMSSSPQGSTYLRHEMARALLKACHVKEHGTGDRNVLWTLNGDTTTEVLWIEEQGVGRIHVVTEQGEPVVRNLWQTRSNWPLHPILGVRGGQHSGNASCIMRSAYADCYTAQGQSDVRYWIEGTEVSLGPPILCTSSVGTGNNISGRDPQSRFGPATNGNCLKQLKVSNQ